MSARYTPDDVGPPPSRNRITFGPGAVAVGFVVGVATLALAFALAWGPGGIVIFPLALFYGFGIGLVTGLPLGIVLGFLLRPVHRQLVHVAVFFAVFAAVTLIISAALSPSTTFGDGFPTALVIGAAAALARASVWKLVRVHDAPPEREETP